MFAFSGLDVRQISPLPPVGRNDTIKEFHKKHKEKEKEKEKEKTSPRDASGACFCRYHALIFASAGAVPALPFRAYPENMRSNH